MKTTREEIKAFMPSLSEDDLDALTIGANADADEGIEWLPYYKMALTRLGECVGTLRALINKNLLDRRERQVLRDAGRLFYEHLIFCGTGRETDPEKIRACEKLAHKAFCEFMEI